MSATQLLKFREQDLDEAWSNESKITAFGTSYRVGRMSYGDYFLEPGKPQGETKPFNQGTLWLTLVDSEERIYGVDDDIEPEVDENMLSGTFN